MILNDLNNKTLKILRTLNTLNTLNTLIADRLRIVWCKCNKYMDFGLAQGQTHLPQVAVAQHLHLCNHNCKVTHQEIWESQAMSYNPGWSLIRPYILWFDLIRPSPRIIWHCLALPNFLMVKVPQGMPWVILMSVNIIMTIAAPPWCQITLGKAPVCQIWTG